MNEQSLDQVGDKIFQGIQLASKRLIERRKKEDGELIYSKNNQIIRIKARDIK